MNFTKYSIAVAIGVAISLPLSAQHKKQTSPILPLDTAVRTGKLPNGFTYYIRHNEEPKNRVELYLVNKVGSILEDENQRGLAHFMEHMSFNGTTHFPKNELVDYLQKSGVRFGADLNAYTGFDETVYQLPIPSDNPALLASGISIMRDWAHNATLEQAEIDKERGVVLEEKRLGKGASERMQRQYWPVILNNSKYSIRIPIGLDTVLNNFKRPTIARFYHDWYRPDLQALIVVGDINVNMIEKIIKTRFSDLKNPINERARTKYTIPLNGKNHFIAVTDREMTSTEVEILIKHPESLLKTLNDYRKAIIQNLFNQILTQRYAELSRLSYPPFIQGSASIGTFMGGTSVFDVNVVANPDELEKGLKAVWREIERLKRFGFTATELERAKQSYLSSIEAALKEKNKTQSVAYVEEYQNYFLKGMAAPGIETEYKLTKNNLPNINLADVNGLVKTYITDANRDVLILAPDKSRATLPDESTVNNWMSEVARENLHPYVDEINKLPLLAYEPKPGTIKSERKNAQLDITTLVLSNGLKVLLKQTDFKNNEIQFTAYAAGGTSLTNDADYQSATNAASIISASGVGNYTPTQLDKYLSDKQLSVKPYINDRFEGISGATTPKDLESALQLIYACFTEPRKDDAIFKGIIERGKGKLANRSNDPNSVFGDTVNSVLSNNNIRRTGPTMEKLNQIDLDKAYFIYKERFADAAKFTFTFVGNFNLQKIKPLLEKYLAALPATNSREDAKDLNIHIPGGHIEKNVYKGSELKSTVLLVYSGEFDYSPENKIKIDALKEALEIRLLQRLREDESGVYSPRVFANVYKFPKARYSFLIQFGCGPQNVKRLIASVQDEINKLRTDGALQENIDKWRAEENTKLEIQLKTNGFWLNYLNEQLQNDEDLNEINSYKSMLDKVTQSGLKDIAGKYLSGDNYIRLVLMPENNSIK